MNTDFDKLQQQRNSTRFEIPYSEFLKFTNSLIEDKSKEEDLNESENYNPHLIQPRDNTRFNNPKPPLFKEEKKEEERKRKRLIPPLFTL